MHLNNYFATNHVSAEQIFPFESGRFKEDAFICKTVGFKINVGKWPKNKIYGYMRIVGVTLLFEGCL